MTTGLVSGFDVWFAENGREKWGVNGMLLACDLVRFRNQLYEFI